MMNATSNTSYKRILWNPAYYLIWYFNRIRVLKRKVAYLPKPYDLSAACLQIRTGRSLPSPLYGKLIKSKKKAPRSTGQQEPSIEPPWLHKQLLVGGEAFALYGAETLHHLSVLDSNAYTAISNLAGHQIDSLANLSSYLGDWKMDIKGQLTEGGLSKLAGHFGEAHAAEHLSNAGIEVIWPGASNQAGWDLLVNDHFVNVKTIADASQLSQHFAQYPNIAALIPADAANIPSDAFHLYPGGSIDGLSRFLEGHDNHAVIVDHGLSHHDVFDHAEQVSDVALGHAGFDAHIPWITVATSGWREFRLLNESKTNIGAASKNLALDVAGRGGGAFLGAKAGAAIGTVFFPGVGSLIGGVLGAIGGAMAGGSVSDSLKRADLKKALDVFQNNKAELEHQSLTLNREAQANLNKEIRAVQGSLSRIAQYEKRQLALIHRENQQRRQELDFLDSKKALVLLNFAEDKIKRYQQALLKQIAGMNVLHKWLLPSINRVAIQQALNDLDGLAAHVTSLKQNMRQHILRDQIFPLLAQIGVAEKLVNDLLQEAESHCAQLSDGWRAEVEKSTARMADARLDGFRELAQFVARTMEWIKKQLQPHVTKTQSAADQVLCEMQKLDLK